MQNQLTKTGRGVCLFEYSIFNRKITRHVKKQENMSQSKEENKMAETIPEETQVLFQARNTDKDF